MYTGHVAIALGARATRDDLPLWVLVLTAQGADWIELLLRPFGNNFEAAVWSHAFPGVFIAAFVAATCAGIARKSLGAAVIVMLVYLSHPLGDLVTSFKVLWLGGRAMGLALVERPAADFVFQMSLCAIGWAAYCRSIPATSRRRFALLSLMMLLFLQSSADLMLWTKDRRLIRNFIVWNSAQRPQIAETGW